MTSRRLILQALLVVATILAGCAAAAPPVRSIPAAGVQSATTRTIVTKFSPAHEDLMPPIILKDVLTNIDALEKTFDWKPFRPGVEIARIYETPDNGPAAAFLRYQPGASVPYHTHSGYEQIFILKGTQSDRAGEHGPGTVVINPPGSSHLVTSPQGCIVLIIWNKPVIIAQNA